MLLKKKYINLYPGFSHEISKLVRKFPDKGKIIGELKIFCVELRKSILYFTGRIKNTMLKRGEPNCIRIAKQAALLT